VRDVRTTCATNQKLSDGARGKKKVRRAATIAREFHVTKKQAAKRSQYNAQEGSPPHDEHHPILIARLKRGRHFDANKRTRKGASTRLRSANDIIAPAGPPKFLMSGAELFDARGKTRKLA
jgi:hypothetical protein